MEEREPKPKAEPIALDAIHASINRSRNAALKEYAEKQRKESEEQHADKLQRNGIKS